MLNTTVSATLPPLVFTIDLYNGLKYTMPKKQTKSSKKAPSFEKAMQELEDLVEQLDQGDVPLDDALKEFERGIELTRICQKSLQDAEQKVSKLISENGIDKLVAFEEED